MTHLNEDQNFYLSSSTKETNITRLTFKEAPCGNANASNSAKRRLKTAVIETLGKKLGSSVLTNVSALRTVITILQRRAKIKELEMSRFT